MNLINGNITDKTLPAFYIFLKVKE